MSRKRIVAVITVLLFVFSVLAGCAKTEQKSTQPGQNAAQPAPKEPVTITFMHFSASPDHLKDMDNIIKAFEAQNPDIKIQSQAVGWDDYWTKFQTAASGGSMPDTFELNYENFVTYAKKGVLLDLTAMAAKDGLDKVYYPKAYQVFNYQGKQFGLVETFSTVVLLYNKDLFDKGKVSYPTDSWTWKDEIEAAKKLTDAKAGIWGSYKPIQFHEFYKTIAQNGGQLMDGDKVVIDSKQNIETLQYMVNRILVDKVQPSEAQMGGQKPEDLFKAGKLAMFTTGIWLFAQFKDAPFKWDIVLEPGNTQKAHHFFANAVSVSKNTKQPEAAYKWAKFLTSSPEAVKVRMDTSWELPAISDPKLVDAYLKQSPPSNRKVVFDSLNNPVVPQIIDQAIIDQVGTELEQASLGKETPAQALSNAKKKIEALIK